MTAIAVRHYSDVLCVWAYVANIRMQELKTEFGDRVALDYRLLPVFGDVARKLREGWEDRGGVAAYARHVAEVVDQFPHVHVHPEVWVRHTPCSSLPAHLYLCAVALAEQCGDAPAGAFEAMAWRLRLGFFAEAEDVSDAEVLRRLAGDCGLPVDRIECFIRSGAAYARLAEDQRLAQDQNVRSSPTLIFNDDRQRLTGNVGYRIIEANVRELLARPAAQNSWC